MNRRQFLWMSAAAGAVIGAQGASSLLAGPKDAAGGDGKAKDEKGGKGRRLLILGGTAYLGPELVDAARARGYTITLFNRGKTNPQMFPDIEKLRGDRNGDLKALEGREWDAVIDTSGYFPRQVRDSATLLRDRVRQYVFISSISVYAERSRPGMDEDTRLEKLQDETVEDIGGGNYGGLKALCEQAAEKAMPGRVANVRPGLIVGPGDPTDRFTYWPVRVQRGGEVLAPGTPKDPVQYIDVRDLAEWLLHVVDARVMGVYNALGPQSILTMGDFLEACRKAAGNDAKLTWVDAKFLEEKEVSAWGDMPMWIPPEGEWAGFGQMSNKRAIDRGLKFRPVDVTIQDTLGWWKTLPTERRAKLKAGISPEKEAAVLKAWHERQAKK